jgi:hypothetical protein
LSLFATSTSRSEHRARSDRTLILVDPLISAWQAQIQN